MVGVNVALVAFVMSVAVVPSTVFHCQVSPVTPPSGSLSEAVTALLTWGLSGTPLTTPASSKLVIVIATVRLIVCPPAVASTVTE